MTRLTENDIAGIEAEWATYERRLEELTGDDLLTLAARTLGIDPETARSGVRELRVGAIPISSGEGLIGGFADSLASIAGHLGFEADVLPADVPGFQLAKSGGFDLFIWADDDTYLAENILTGTVGENGRATGRGFATALIRMAARKRLDKRALVLGAGPVGCAGAETLALAGYEVFLCDMDGEKARVACGALSGCTPCTPDDLSGLPLFECLLDAGLAVAASHALDVDNLRLDDRAREFLFRHLDVSAAAAAALSTPMLDDTFECEEQCHEDEYADDCCSHDGFLLYRDESVS